MQKKLLLVLNVVLFSGLTNSITINAGTIKTAAIIAGIGAIGAGGSYAKDMNKEYAEAEKDPDTKLLLVKAGAAITMVIGAEYVSASNGSGSDLAENLIKIAVGVVAFGAHSDRIARCARYIPLLGDVITDPIDPKTGKENKHIGACVRTIMTYVALKGLALEGLKACTSGSMISCSKKKS
ncbi:MAG TPA: hypothetical protein VLB80_05195 [Candidatus Babeliales bacterium]|nr:hypothetical protein [Candidatus Babeliales bacterium]